MPQLVEDMAESKKGPGAFIPLTPKQAEGVAKNLESKGATFFDWPALQELVKKFPPNTPFVIVLNSFKKRK